MPLPKVLTYSGDDDSKTWLTLPRFLLYCSWGVGLALAAIVVDDAHERYERGRAAQRAAAEWDLRALCEYVVRYRNETGLLPPDEEGWSIMVDTPGERRYLRVLPVDPWKHIYRYRRSPDGSSFTVSSDGPDRTPGTRDDIVFDSSVK